MSDSLEQTQLCETHQSAGARMVNFGGWLMPLHYGSQIHEHHAVRQKVGCFDVSHMGIVDITGTQAQAFLQYLMANDVGRLQTQGKALYSCMLNEQGGVIDDLIIYLMQPERYRVVVNAANRQKDLLWIKKQAQQFQVEVCEQTALAMVAVQGPEALSQVLKVIPQEWRAEVEALKPFVGVEKGDYFIARTGYTGEDGFEISLPAQDVVNFWQELVKNGVQPCGLGARDTLRLEAGMNLYGHEMDENSSPLVAGLAWTIAMDPPDRAFVGRAALQQQLQEGVAFESCGLVLLDRGICREGQIVEFSQGGQGVVTSGGFSPTLNRSIGLMRIPKESPDECAVIIRGKKVAAKRVKLPFVRHGCINVSL